MLEYTTTITSVRVLFTVTAYSMYSSRFSRGRDRAALSLHNEAAKVLSWCSRVIARWQYSLFGDPGVLKGRYFTVPSQRGSQPVIMLMMSGKETQVDDSTL